jgi:hypothetical protein
MSDSFQKGDGTEHVVDLCAGKGGLSQAFADAEDWSVTTVDIQERFDPDIQADVLDLRPDDLPDAEVFLAGPPCTTMSVAGNQTDHYVDGEPNSELARTHVALAYHVVGLIRAKSPKWWFVENPRGRMRRYLGQPTGTVTLCQYGYDWQKPTDLWGEHPPSFRYRRCSPGADCHVSGPSGFDSGDGVSHARDPAERAKMPQGLSEAILNAVENPEPQYGTPEVVA